ncbi:MAG: hypothetical protein GC181_00095 [Bacteroidetes bacterium]|nr:hypothetical protein [Bacteroidota bacterium]
MIRKNCFSPESSLPISFWRILFGLILIFESFGSLLIGYTKRVFVDPPERVFTFIGFDWLMPHPGSWVYWIYVVMGLLAVAITTGYFYRISMVGFSILWTWTYLSHKVGYNNHHYLMVLLCWMMVFIPANMAMSLDVKQGRVRYSETTSKIFRWQFILLLWIVYTYASIAKMYPDWMHGDVIESWFAPKKSLSLIGGFYAWKFTPLLISWGGILFDLLVIPFLLIRKTRTVAFVIGIFFHVINSISFQIGTFPYLMIASGILFFTPETLEKKFGGFFRKCGWKKYAESGSRITRNQNRMLVLYFIFFLIQIILPLRHYAYSGEVLWTEEGHRLSWRMMLRSKTGRLYFRISKPNGEEELHDPSKHLSEDQLNLLAGHPDVIWQYCQQLKEMYGPGIKIFASGRVRLNERTPAEIIDPYFDLAKAEWEMFRHSTWITIVPEYNKRE